MNERQFVWLISWFSSPCCSSAVRVALPLVYHFFTAASSRAPRGRFWVPSVVFFVAVSLFSVVFCTFSIIPLHLLLQSRAFVSCCLVFFFFFFVFLFRVCPSRAAARQRGGPLRLRTSKGEREKSNKKMVKKP